LLNLNNAIKFCVLDNPLLDAKLSAICQGVIANFVSKIHKFGKGPSINVTIPLSINVLKKSTLVQGAEKLCSKSGEDRSINDVTISSTDAGHWRLVTSVK